MDEFDLAGMCEQRKNCSFFQQPSRSGQCAEEDCPFLVKNIRSFLKIPIQGQETEITKGAKFECWINSNTEWNMGAISKLALYINESQ